MQYGLAKSGSCLISNIARSLDEDTKLNSIDRLCDNLAYISPGDKKTMWNNYLDEVNANVDLKNPIVLFDDSDINKEYSKKLQDLDKIIDASSLDKKIVNGYHVCEATVLTKNYNQPISIYSKIYSCKRENFESKNTFTLESIKSAESLFGDNFTGIFDRGYDDKNIFDYMTKNKHKFVVRLDDKRTLLFKGKKRSVQDVAVSRKGKILYKAQFSNEAVELKISYTRAVLSYNKKEYHLVIVYGLSETNPMKLLTNLDIKDSKDVIKIVRLYLSRWRIEEHFRAKKQEYDFENMRVRALESMNNLNMFLAMHLGHISILADAMNTKLLTIKIIYAGKSLRNQSIVWLSQITRGLKEILKYEREGIFRWKSVEQREKNRQLAFIL